MFIVCFNIVYVFICFLFFVVVLFVVLLCFDVCFMCLIVQCSPFIHCCVMFFVVFVVVF